MTSTACPESGAGTLRGNFPVEIGDFFTFGGQVAGDFGAQGIEFGFRQDSGNLEWFVAGGLVARDGGFEIDEEGFIALQGGLQAACDIL